MAQNTRSTTKQSKAATSKKISKTSKSAKATTAKKTNTKAPKAASKPRRNKRTRCNLVPKRLLDRFDSYTVAQIKAELAQRGVEAAGLKQDLFMALIQEEEEHHDDAEAETEEPEGNVEEGDDVGSLPDYESDPPASQDPAATCGGAQGSCGASDGQQAQEEQPKGPFDCVAHFSGMEVPGPKIENDERPQPHDFFIPQAALDTILSDLIGTSPDHVSNILQKLGDMNPDYMSMKTGDVLQWHMPERYLIARINQHYDQGLLTETPFERVCQGTWASKLMQDWRTAKFMSVADVAPAFLREWSAALKAGQLCYPQMPTNYAENQNQQWSFGRALLFTPKLLDLFKQLVAEGKLQLPCSKDTGDVTEQDLQG